MTYVDEKRASQYLRDRWGIRAAPRTLANWRWRGGGPLFHKTKSGFVIYAAADLDAFAAAFIGEPRASPKRKHGVTAALSR